MHPLKFVEPFFVRRKVQNGSLLGFWHGRFERGSLKANFDEVSACFGFVDVLVVIICKG